MLPALAVWSLLSLAACWLALWEGYAGRSLAGLLGFFCLSLGVILVLAARGAVERFAGPGGGLLVGALVFVAYVFYAVGTGSFSFLAVVTVAALVFVPLAVALAARARAPGSWHDFLILAGLWTFVKFGPSKWLWPYPGGRLAYVFTVLLAVSVALAAFLLIRSTAGTGYLIGWGPGWGFSIAAAFLGFSVIAIFLGLRMGFIAFAPRWYQWPLLLPMSLGILLFTAWPEELLFRGLLQNLLAKASRSDSAGWWTASVLFGFSHITNMGFPNWRYVILATIAGFFYGWVWKRTGSILASAIVHALVDALWHFLFRTL